MVDEKTALNEACAQHRREGGCALTESAFASGWLAKCRYDRESARQQPTAPDVEAWGAVERVQNTMCPTYRAVAGEMVERMEGRISEGDLHSIIKALFALPQRPVDGWQPISTAPRDGTKILAYGAHCDGRPNPYILKGCCYWHEGLWLGGPFSTHCEPQYWQPYPEIPAPIASKQGGGDE